MSETSAAEKSESPRLQPEPALNPSLVALLAGGAGLSVAAIYYNQPILSVIAHDLHASTQEIGFVPMLTQLGYSAGLIFFAPLGDKLDRRRVIVIKTALLCLALLGAALASGIVVLCIASLAIGLLASAAQDFVPAAAALAPPHARGKIVGSVMTGLLLGILLSRLLAGAMSDRFGWRSVFFFAAATVLLLCIVSAIRLPRFRSSTNESYVSLLRSIAVLARDLAPLRRAALAQAFFSVAFSGFWSTLALVLAGPPYHLSSTVAGAFGLAGAAGALAAPIAGSIADKRGPIAVIRVGAVLVAGSFLAMGLWQGSVLVLIVGAVVFDAGVQASLISHQTIIYGLDPKARSRLNAVLVGSMFLGMAVGAALASFGLAHFGWTGVCVQGTLAALAALVVRAWPSRAPQSLTQTEVSSE